MVTWPFFGVAQVSVTLCGSTTNPNEYVSDVGDVLVHHPTRNSCATTNFCMGTIYEKHIYKYFSYNTAAPEHNKPLHASQHHNITNNITNYLNHTSTNANVIQFKAAVCDCLLLFNASDSLGLTPLRQWIHSTYYLYSWHLTTSNPSLEEPLKQTELTPSLLNDEQSVEVVA